MIVEILLPYPIDLGSIEDFIYGLFIGFPILEGVRVFRKRLKLVPPRSIIIFSKDIGGAKHLLGQVLVFILLHGEGKGGSSLVLTRLIFISNLIVLTFILSRSHGIHIKRLLGYEVYH